MNIPLSWLREYVDITLPIPQLVERLTLAGLEVGGVRMVGLPPPEGLHVKSEDAGPVWDRDKIFVAQVLEVRRHPDADRLTLVDLEYGAAQPKTVVTGAPNLKAGERGQKVILALAGSTLYDGHADGKVLKTLKPTKIRGVPSDAMVCSSKELGIAEEHEGIILLDDDAPVGTPLADYMGDVVLEIDILPNMARCLSIIGIAREVAAITGQSLRYPSTEVQAGAEDGRDARPPRAQVEVRIEDPKLCARYAAGLIRDIRIGPSPYRMQYRLTLAGMRPINNIVDITNYVMLEWGQPLHAFDYDKLMERAGGKAPTIIVRSAKPGETLTTLDKQKRELAPEHLLIADTAGPIALAGVMGGLDTEVTETTRNILLESANFDFISIRKTARALNLPSEASYRFSRGVHPAIVPLAANRAAELMRRYAGGTVAQGLVEQYPAPPAAQKITLPMSEVARILGFSISMDEAARILRALEFEVEARGDSLIATTPPHRLDIQHGTADLIEELARISGYDRMPATVLREQLPEQRNNRPLELEERVRDILVNCGLQEVMSYSLTTPEKEAVLIGKSDDYIRLANPISSERVVMRRSVLASVLEAAASNLRNTDRIRLFEIGRVYLPRPGEKLPDEPLRLALVLTGPRGEEAWNQPTQDAFDFFDLKGTVEELLAELHVPPVDYVPGGAGYLHPGRSAQVMLNKQPLGAFGQLHPGLTELLGLGRRAVLCGEFDLEALLAAVPERHAFRPIPEFPPVRQDIAIVVDETLPAERVASEIWAAGKELLRDVRLFDLYRGPNLPPGKKSLAYALTYQSFEKTLTDKEVAKVHSKIVARLEKVLGGQLRG